MKAPRSFFVEPAEDRARTRRRVVARGSEPPAGEADAKPRVRIRPAVVLTTKPTVRAVTETEIVDTTTPEHTKPTRQVQHAKNLFAMLDPEPDPDEQPTVPEIAIARRETHRTRRLQISESELVEMKPDGTRTGQIPLSDWTAARVPSIDVTPRATSLVDGAKRQYRRGVLMGAAIATAVAASVATAFALLV